MKLKTLRIENLASISEATIDFEAAPIGDASVFLISGETGSGKSTILDAICLALYNTVPRMEAASVGRGDIAASDNETRTDHVFQLLRKGTSHTFVSLRFTGLDDKEYEAHWGIRRARNKPDGKLQENSMDLTLALITTDSEGNEVSREEIRRTRKDCAKITESVIGLSYAQFCRTTMLAQGEFTRFIKSDGAEKSQILAKVTDRRDFLEIGRTIHEIATEKKRELDEIRRDIAGVEFLSDETLAELDAAIREADSRLTDCDTRGTAVAGKLEWLGKNADLDVRIKKNAQLEQQLKTRTESEDFIADELRAHRWFETEGARRDLKLLRKTRDSIAATDRQLVEYRKIYGTIAAARLNLADTLDNAVKLHTQLKDAALTFETKRPLAGHETEVCKMLSSICERQRDMKSTTERMEERRRDILKADATLAEATAKAEELDKAYKTATEQTAEARRLLNEIDLPGVTKRMSELSERKTLLATFAADTARYVEDADNADTLQAEIKTERDRHEADTKQCDTLDANLAKAKSAMEAAKLAYETARLTVDDFTQRLRESLTIGCECPVCRQKVEHAVSFDMTAGLEYVTSLRDQADKARDDHDALTKEIAETRGALKKALDEIMRKEKRLADVREALAVRLAGLAVRASELIGAAPESQPAQWCDVTAADIEKTDTTLDSLRRLAESAKPLQEKLDDCIKAEKKALKAMNAGIELKTKAEKDLASLQTSLKADEDSLKRNETDIAETHERLTAMIERDVWTYRTPGDAESFEKTFAADCAKIRELDCKAETQAREVERLKGYLEQTDAESKSICDRRPDFSDAKSDGAESTLADGAALVSKARKLAADVTVAVAGLDRSKAEERELTSAMVSFREGHPGYDDDALDALDGTSRTEAERMRDGCQEIHNRLKAAANAALQLDAEKKELEAVRPEMAEEDTPENLRAETERIKTEQAEANRTKGAAMQKIEDDRRNRQKTAGLREKAERLQKVCDRWSAFDNRLGSPAGDKFNRIAQSYVLSDLLERANVYLSRLTDRYRLAGSPGSYDISIIDSMQGDSVRSVHSTSGGEGFLVSLSLALALGDLGNRLAVDPLFIDEGFGSLSGVPLQHAIDLLNSLRRQLGRRVGVISHIGALRESIPVQLHMVTDPDTAATSIEIVQF